jgi:uncharacterized membrane protein
MVTEDVDSDTSTTEHSTERSTERPNERTVQGTQGTGLGQNVAGALSYLFGALTGIIFYVLEPEDEFVRFHAAQSIVVSVAFFILAFGTSIITTILGVLGGAGAGASVVFGLVSLVISLIWLLVGLAGFGLWLFLMLRTYQGNRTRIPIAASVADRIA